MYATLTFQLLDTQGNYIGTRNTTVLPRIGEHVRAGGRTYVIERVLHLDEPEKMPTIQLLGRLAGT
jgi:hypothetical protein